MREEIKRMQVRHKMDEAKRRTLFHMTAAIDAPNAELYEEQVKSACKAANDYNIWKTVLNNMQ